MSPLSRLRILVTEDEPDTRALLELILRAAGFDVISTANSRQALQLAQTNTLDLYLLDNWMAGLSGIDLCRQLRAFDQKTPILFYSGAAYESDKEAALAAGAQGYLVKPCDPAKMLSEILRLTSNQQSIGQVSSDAFLG
jgi:DNA-binding response OmpR family regulator